MIIFRNIRSNADKYNLSKILSLIVGSQRSRGSALTAGLQINANWKDRGRRPGARKRLRRPKAPLNKSGRKDFVYCAVAFSSMESGC
jgi:hypothetical protein